MDWQSIVPMERALKNTDLSRAREVRLRPGQPLQALLPGGVWQGVHPLTTSEILQAAQALSGYALAARTQELRQGFIPLAGGHRLGVCGRMGPGGMTEISSLCVRMAHEIRGVGAAIFPQVRNRSTLIAGPPGEKGWRRGWNTRWTACPWGIGRQPTMRRFPAARICAA